VPGRALPWGRATSPRLGALTASSALVGPAPRASSRSTERVWHPDGSTMQIKYVAYYKWAG